MRATSKLTTKSQQRKAVSAAIEALESRLLLSTTTQLVVLSTDTSSGLQKLGLYDGTTGSAVNAKLVGSLAETYGVAVSGSDIFVLQWTTSGQIGEYTTAGKTVNSQLITGVGTTLDNYPAGLAITGSNIFVASDANQVGEYTTSGGITNSQLILGIGGAINTPSAIAVSGSDIFVAYGNQVGEWTTAGNVVNSNLITIASSPGIAGIAVSGSDLYIESSPTTVSEYTTAGKLVSASLITGFNNAAAIAATSSDLYIADSGTGKVSEYTTSGTLVKSGLITGLSSPTALAIVTTTPPATTPGTISGSVMQQVRRTDSAMPGVTVTMQALVGGKLSGSPVNVTTDSKGNYTFSNVAIGSYEITESVPRGYEEISPSAKEYTINVTSGLNSTGNNFVDQVIPPASIGGSVLLQVSKRSEPAIAGVTVTLQQMKSGKPSGTPGSTKTNSSGAYNFTGVGAGTYQVTAAVPRGDKVLSPAAGSYTITVIAGQDSTGNNFVDVAKTTAVMTASPFMVAAAPVDVAVLADPSSVLFGCQDSGGLFAS